MANQSQRIRKQMFDLSATDFRECAVWEFCLDEEGLEGQDETTVRPSALKELPSNSMGSFLVAADVVFGDGTKGFGYLFSDERDVISASPAVFVGDKKVQFQIPGSLSNERVEERKGRYYTDIGMDRQSIFPISFTSLIPVAGRPMSFVLDGFIFNGGPRKGQTIR
jgi:hypothetical protein